MVNSHTLGNQQVPVTGLYQFQAKIDVVIGHAEIFFVETADLDISILFNHQQRPG